MCVCVCVCVCEKAFEKRERDIKIKSEIRQQIIETGTKLYGGTRNTKGGCITVPLTSCLTCLD